MPIDRRTRYTKMIIRDSLYELLEQKPLSDITVKELCQTADINRATFYRYYDNVDALFEQLEQEIVDISFQQKSSCENSTVHVLTVIKENRIFYKELFRAHMDSKTLSRLLEQQKQEAILYHQKNGSYDETIFPYAFQYVVSGSTGMIQKWVNSGCQETPAEFAEIIFKITGGCATLA